MAYSLSFSKSILVLIFISDKTRRGETEFISTKIMSDLLSIPKPTLSVILTNLMRAGILYTKEGAGGGFRMAKPEDQITLLDILLAIESEKPLFQTEFGMKASGDRPDRARVIVSQTLKSAESLMKEELKKTTLKTLLESM